MDLDDILAQNRDELVQLCRRHRVRWLEVFGSAVEGRFEPLKSALDFIVEFLDLSEGEHAEAYFCLLEGLRELFGMPVDLVMISAVRNPYFLQAIESSRILLYAA